MNNERYITINRQKFVVIILGLAIALVLFAGWFFAEQAVQAAPSAVLNYEEITENETLVAYKVTGIDTKDNANVIIPSDYRGYPVVEIADFAFSGQQNLRTIDFSQASNLTSIGAYAFKDCRSLGGKVVLPESLKNLNVGVFFGCISLEKLEFNNGLKFMPSLICEGATALTSITLPKTLESIGLRAFATTSITRITLPSSLTTVDRFAFAQASFLQEVDVLNEEGVTFNLDCFEDCESLTKIVFHSQEAYMSALKGNSYLSTSGYGSKAILYQEAPNSPGQQPESPLPEIDDEVTNPPSSGDTPEDDLSTQLPNEEIVQNPNKELYEAELDLTTLLVMIGITCASLIALAIILFLVAKGKIRFL